MSTWFHLCSYMTSAHSARLGATLANNTSHRNTHENIFLKKVLTYQQYFILMTDTKNSSVVKMGSAHYSFVSHAHFHVQYCNKGLPVVLKYSRSVLLLVLKLTPVDILQLHHHHHLVKLPWLANELTARYLCTRPADSHFCVHLANFSPIFIIQYSCGKLSPLSCKSLDCIHLRAADGVFFAVGQLACFGFVRTFLRKKNVQYFDHTSSHAKINSLI